MASSYPEATKESLGGKQHVDARSKRYHVACLRLAQGNARNHRIGLWSARITRCAGSAQTLPGAGEAHEISGKAAATGSAVVALRPGTGFYLSRLPEALRRHGKVCRGLPKPRAALVLCLCRRRHRVVRRRASGAEGD